MFLVIAITLFLTLLFFALSVIFKKESVLRKVFKVCGLLGIAVLLLHVVFIAFMLFTIQYQITPPWMDSPKVSAYRMMCEPNYCEKASKNPKTFSAVLCDKSNGSPLPDQMVPIEECARLKEEADKDSFFNRIKMLITGKSKSTPFDTVK